MEYFDIHTKRRPINIARDGDMMDQFAQATAGDLEALPPRSDNTDSVYSSGPTPPASPMPALAKLTTDRLQPDIGIRSLSPFPTACFDTESADTNVYASQPTTTARVSDRPSGKSGQKASSIIDVYREKERQAAVTGSPGKSTVTSQITVTSRTPGAGDERVYAASTCTPGAGGECFPT
jgi:hypothetical protein